MLIPYSKLLETHNIQVHGILHIGAHKCEELEAYVTGGCPKDRILWIEGNPELYKFNKQKDSEIKILNYLVHEDDDKEIIFNITNNGQSSSVLELGLHQYFYPGIIYVKKIAMFTKRVDTIYKEHNIDPNFANFLNIDIQGAELLALKGMGDLLHNFDYLYLEVNTDYVYKDCALVGEIDDYLSKYGFKRIETQMTDQRWGDAFYVKQK